VHPAVLQPVVAAQSFCGLDIATLNCATPSFLRILFTQTDERVKKNILKYAKF
jgi:hypothetical protein